MSGTARFIAIVVLATAVPTWSLGSPQAPALRQRVIDHHFRFMPPGDGPFATVIAIPGCSGIALQDAAAEAAHPDLTEGDRLFRSHYPIQARLLRDAGFAVLLIHVHGAENLLTACAGQIPGARIAEYIDESIAWARQLDFVDVSQIHVVGWSMGGRGVLAWLDGARHRDTEVRSAVAVYPACEGERPPTNRVPTLMLLGGADDIADPSACEDLAAASPIRSMITVRRYPGARHGFDIAAAPALVDAGSGRTIGFQQEAAAAAWREMLEFLSANR